MPHLRHLRKDYEVRVSNGLPRTARDLRIGDIVAVDEEGDKVRVKRLHELCSRRPTPHVHAALTDGEIKCMTFGQSA